MVATGETVGLAEWIIDDTCLVNFCYWSLYFLVATDGPTDRKIEGSR